MIKSTKIQGVNRFNTLERLCMFLYVVDVKNVGTGVLEVFYKEETKE